jgi:hypothetical protein
MRTFKSVVAGAAAIILFGLHGAASAGTIIGGSSMLNAGHVTQLESWLGEGPLALTNIFTKGVTGSNATDWHNSVDGLGRTFSILEITAFDPQQGQNVTQIIGGYNPQSWHSSGGYNVTTNDVDRTAFIFNLTAGVLQRQCLSTDPLACGTDAADTGRFQTHNSATNGPTFGGGFDLNVTFDLNGGTSSNYSYDVAGGLPGAGSENGLDPNPLSAGWISVGALETFTIAADTQVPEPGMLLLFGIAVVGVGRTRRNGAIRRSCTAA